MDPYCRILGSNLIERAGCGSEWNQQVPKGTSTRSRAQDVDARRGEQDWQKRIQAGCQPPPSRLRD
jgi:hypothetical protein